MAGRPRSFILRWTSLASASRRGRATAWGRGAAREPGGGPGGGEPATGIFFERQSVDDLMDAIRRFESGSLRFEPKALRRRAEAFDRPVFKERIEQYLATRHAEHARC